MRTKIYRFLILSVVATGLVTGSLPSGAAPATKAKQKTENAGQLLENAELTGRVKSALLADKVAPGLSINVNSDQGVVTLLGQVDTATQKNRAAQVAQKTEGVKKVVNKLTVKATSENKTSTPKGHK